MWLIPSCTSEIYKMILEDLVIADSKEAIRYYQDLVKRMSQLEEDTTGQREDSMSFNNENDCSELKYTNMF